MTLKVIIVPVTPFQQNCSLIWCDQTMQGALIDPGGDIDKLLQRAQQERVSLTQVLLTHGHIDHAGSARILADQINVPVIGPEKEDDFWLAQLAEQAAACQFDNVSSFKPDKWLSDGDKVSVGEEILEVLHCPGHTPGHVVFYHRTSKLAFVGDLLFQGSIGRTDFPRGDMPTLLKSVVKQLWPLGDEVRFVPGHGPLSTFGEERQTNPFVGDAALANQPF